MESKDDRIKELDEFIEVKKGAASNDWEKHSLLVLETLKDLKQGEKDLDKRIKSLENKVIAVTAIATFLGSLWGFYATYSDIIDKLILLVLDK